MTTDTIARRRILVFDDSPLVLAMTRAALEGAGYEVETALDLNTFEARRESTPPDLILVDVQMPEAFGDDVAATLRGYREVKTPIVLVSNLDRAELARRATEACADGWVSKADGVAELVRRVKELLA
jgi:DNA-binding response OmpR family regulator